MFEVYAKDYRITIQEIPLGNQGEDMARCLVMDITDAVDEFGSGGTVTVRNKRNGDEMPYMATNVTTVTGADATGRTHTYIKWTLTDVDTAVAGSGFVQADYIIAGVTVKTWVYKYFILPSLGVTGDVPDPYEDILEEITAQVAAVQAAAASAEASAAEAEASATRIISTVTDTVEDWLGEHIISGYAVDDTLSIRGAAADAAATGDLKSQIYSAFVTENASGSIASFTDGADDVPVKDLVVNITPVQSGTGDPSPSNIRSISSFTEANIVRSGKNMIDQTAFVQGSISGAGADTNVYTRLRSPFVRVNSGQKYTFQCNSEVLIFELHRYDANQNWLGYVSVNQTQTTYTVPSGVEWIKVLCRKSDNTVVQISELTAFQMEVGDTKTDYEPYNGEVYNVSFGSAGTVYGGTLDATSGMLTVTHLGARVGDLTVYTSFTVGSAAVVKRYRLPSTSTTAASSAYHGAVSSMGLENMAYFGAMRQNESSSVSGGKNFAISTDGVVLAVYDADLTLTDTTFSTKYANDFVVYPLAQPVSYQLTPTEVRTLLANNNIWSDTGSVASCEYRADTQLYIEKLTHPDSDMVADANIASGQYFMVNNTLYLATAAIASGATIVPGTNCTETSLATALNAINA